MSSDGPAAARALSVALASHNGARYLEEQLRSILDQTVLPREIVLADDDSRDGTVDLARAVVGDTLPLRILEHRPALGVRENFSRAIAHTEGDLIALCDQDDRWHPTRVERALDYYAARPGTELLFTNARMVDTAGMPLGYTLFDALEFGAEERALIQSGRGAEAFLRRNLATGATVTLRRTLFDRAAPIPDPWIHDEWLAVIAAARGSVSFLDEPLIDYRQHDSNQIGMRKPGLRVKIDRVLEPRGDRNRTLARRTDLLVEALARPELEVPADILARARGKQRMERFRAELPTTRIRRLLPVLGEARRGDYARFTSQGRLEILRDLLQPA
ncbi:glycosyltransferase family 2 protein [Mycetocola tolaasinivorans]|uniref:Glycosyltransferase family 2 protein n=1 Tax=Mycetocola tolaasinivorans TaxID=76635 RepID=A0A3L7A7U7_9MICO|nr:glycosyltransferase family 2 protein [Mycetocola tolaasinivorans]